MGYIRRVFNHRFLLGSGNLMFLICGLALLSSGVLLFIDENRIVLSRILIATNIKSPLTDLAQPLFLYVAYGLMTAGMLATIAALIGCWASCMNNYCVLTINFMLILTLLVLEFAICLMITVWPQCLGLNLDETLLVKTLQGQYGISGQEQFTTAMDLAQTQFECCAINSAINYDTSLWKLQSLGQKDLTVPLTCCKLANRAEAKAYLDPKPANLTQCQALQPQEYEKGRHLAGCLTKIDLWYREQYVVFLIAGLVVAIVEFCVLLSIIYSCTKLSTTAAVHKIQHPKAGATAKSQATRSHSTQQIIHGDGESREASSSPASTALMDVREVYVQPKSLQKPKYAVPFKPSYQVSKSYLV